VTVLRLPIRPADDFHQFRDLAALIGPVATVDRVFYAMSHVILEDFLLDPAKSSPDRGDLGDEVRCSTGPRRPFSKARELGLRCGSSVSGTKP
jgi:hypothetical protein